MKRCQALCNLELLLSTMAKINNRLQLSQINLTKKGMALQRYDYAYGQSDATNTTRDAKT